MTNYFLSANNKKYDHEGSFNKNGFIDWVQRNNNIAVGDYVFIYCASPIKEIRYKCKVLKTNMIRDEKIDDSEFWTSPEVWDDNTKYMRLSLLKTVIPGFTLESMKKLGFNGPQKCVRLKDELYAHISTMFDLDVYPDSSGTDDCIEGACVAVKVNRYERDPVARNRCIEYHGYRCATCNLLMEDVYGEYGRDFIHVHHVIPLSEIKHEYVVDPIKDLIPLCPNCHAIIHRSKLTVDELRKIMIG